MKTATILAIDNALSSTISGPFEILSLTGTQWNYHSSFDPSPYFNVEIESEKGTPIRCFNGVTKSSCPNHLISKNISVMLHVELETALF